MSTLSDTNATIPEPKASFWQRGFFGLIRKNKQAKIGFAIISFMLGLAVVVAITNFLHIQIVPYNPLTQNVGPDLAAPSLAHPFGTDEFGRDVFSRLIVATPNDMGIGLAVVGFALIVGTVIGSVAAFRGGLIDEILMRGTDIIFALPALVLALVIAIAIGPGLLHMTYVLMIIWWPSYARLARGQALKIINQNYIEAAKLSGKGTFPITFKHIIPNLLTTLIVYATLDIGGVVLVYAGLSYLGVSVTPPAPDWGASVSNYQDYILSAPWLPLIPGAIIAFVVVGYSLLGDGLRDALEMR
jgi:peptide/nickel transport system permease protein